MKNHKYKSISLVIIFFITLNSIAQNRNVIWVHGYGGNRASWEHYNTIFDNERQINSLRIKYDTDHGIDNAANKVETSVNTLSNPNDPRNLGIGHSMGGLMIRDVDRLTPSSDKKFGGLITVATPNYGAPIANSISDGSVTAAAQNACNKLGDGPLAQLFSLPWGIVTNLSTNVLCKKFIDNDLIADLQGSRETTEDLKTGSSTINAINNYNTGIPRISIWAEETSPVHWRMFSTLKYEDDEKLVKKVNSARAVYNSYFAYNTALAVSCGVGGFWNPACWFMSALFTYRATQWKKGRNWIDNSENIWSSLIKTTRIEQQTYWVEVWIPCDYRLYSPARIDPDCDGDWEWQQRTRNVSVNYPSDGLIPQYSQELQGIPSGNRYKVTGANHLEVLDMSAGAVDETADQFILIFGRTDWFWTPRR